MKKKYVRNRQTKGFLRSSKLKIYVVLFYYFNKLKIVNLFVHVHLIALVNGHLLIY